MRQKVQEFNRWKLSARVHRENHLLNVFQPSAQMNSLFTTHKALDKCKAEIRIRIMAEC